MEQEIDQLAADYFAYVAARFPVMCASDEFHFIPRAEAAKDDYDRMEDLSQEMIAGCIDDLKDLKRRSERLSDRLSEGTSDLEGRIDLAMLRANLSGILIELEEKASWRHNPLLYLKIAFIGLEHALTKPPLDDTERLNRIRSRLEAIPRLLAEGEKNLDRIPENYHRAGMAMIRDAIRYVSRTGQWLSAKEMLAGIDRGLGKVSVSLKAFEAALQRSSPPGKGEFPLVSILDMTLRDHFLCEKDLEEIFQIGEEEWHRSQERLEALQRRIDPHQTWQALYHGYNPHGAGDVDTRSLYEREARQLARFFEDLLFDRRHVVRRLDVVPTPAYLQSVRGSASFSAAFGDHKDESDLFYITTDGEEGEKNGLRGRLHREYRFLTAHETVPGHQLLDSVRRSLPNQIRRQIESPLFYEGWACYAESLLVEYGYVRSSMEELVDMKRRLWRAARCQVDVGLNTGKLSQEDAIGLIAAAGFSKEEAGRQVDRFKLNPGYQLCYTLGHHEIMALRKRYGGDMGRGRFHRHLLEGGELAFHLAEERFRRATGSLK